MATDINLQPTDRCLIKTGETTVTRTTIKSCPVECTTSGGGGALGYLYSGTARYGISSGTILSLTVDSVSPSSASATVSIASDTAFLIDATYQSSTYESSAVTVTVEVSVEYSETVDVTDEAFVIKNTENAVMWQKVKPVTMSFDTSQISYVSFEEDLGHAVGNESGGLTRVTESTVCNVRAGGSISNIEAIPMDRYVVISSASNIDLSDVGALTLDSFSEETLHFAAEEFVIHPDFISSIKNQLLQSNKITEAYVEYVDYTDGSYQGILESNSGIDTFVAYDYILDNNDVERLVIYKTDTSVSTSADTEEPYFFVGKETIEGVVYDKWRKIETGDGQFTWDSTQQKYSYTNEITESLSSGNVMPLFIEVGDISEDGIGVTVYNLNNRSVTYTLSYGWVGTALTSNTSGLGSRASYSYTVTPDYSSLTSSATFALQTTLFSSPNIVRYRYVSISKTTTSRNIKVTTGSILVTAQDGSVGYTGTTTYTHTVGALLSAAGKTVVNSILAETVITKVLEVDGNTATVQLWGPAANQLTIGQIDTTQAVISSVGAFTA